MKKFILYSLGLLTLNTSVIAEDDEPRLDAPEDPPARPIDPPLPVPDVNPKAPNPDAKPAVKNGETRFGQIYVVGGRQVTRGGIASIVEAMRVEMNKLTSEPKRELKIPIIISLYGKQGDDERKQSIVSKIDQIQGEWQLRLYIHLAKGVDLKRLRYHVMELLLYERGLGDGQQLMEGERVFVQPWLISGILEALEIKAGRADRTIYQAQLPYFDILSLEKVLSTSESELRSMEGRQPLAFRAISGALVNSILRQPSGRPNMSKYLAAVATYKGEIENLMHLHFPGMNNSKNSMGKWVDLEMAELGTMRTSDVYSIFETEKYLKTILKLRYNDEEEASVTVDIADYQQVLKLDTKERFAAVAVARAELERLSYRCFPIYRPLLAEYEIILREVIMGKDKGISIRLKNLSKSRESYVAAGERVRDYLDWYYITQSNEVGGDFKAYMELNKALEEERIKPKRQDSIQRYLNQIEKVFMGSTR